VEVNSFNLKFLFLYNLRVRGSILLSALYNLSYSDKNRFGVVHSKTESLVNRRLIIIQATDVRLHVLVSNPLNLPT